MLKKQTTFELGSGYSLAVACALLAAVAPALSAQGRSGSGGAEKALPVVITRVERVADFSETVEALGTTLANESVTLTANATELVDGIFFEDGQTVKRGDVLVLLEQREEQATLKAAKATLDERLRSFERARELVDQNALSSAVLDERRALLQEAEGRVEEIEARIRDRVVTAPFDGLLGLRQISPGTLLQPGDVITTIDDLSRIRVDFQAPAIFLAALRPGLEVVGRIAAYGDERFKGTVATVSSRVDPLTRTVTVRAVLPNPEFKLRPGLLMSIELAKNPRSSRLIPEGAIIQRGRSSSVFVVENGAEGKPPVARTREVVLGTRIPGKVEVLDGLGDDDRVILHGLMQVRDGQALQILGESDGSQPLASFYESEKTADSPQKKGPSL